MAFNAGEVKGRLELDAKGFIRAAKAAGISLREVDKNAKQANRSITVFGATVASAAGNLAARGIAATLRKGFQGLTAVVRGSIDAFVEQERATRSLSTALAQAGGTNVPKLTAEIQAFADELQRTTTIGDEAAESFIAQGVAMGVPTDRAAEFGQTVADMSAATGKSLEEVSRQVAKTFGGFAGELGEVFPAIKELTAEQLKAGGAVELLGKRYAGAAAELTKTTGGAIQQAKNAFGDLQEAIGEVFGPVIVSVANRATEIFQGFSDSVQNNAGAIREAFATAGAFLLDVFARLANTLAFTIDAVVSFGQTINSVVPAAAVAWSNLKLTVAQLKQEVLDLLAALPGVGGAFDEAAAAAAQGVRNAQAELRQMKAQQIEFRNAQLETAAATRTITDGIRSAAQGARDLAAHMKAAATASKDAGAGTTTLSTTVSAAARTAARLAELQKRTKMESEGAAQATGRMREQMEGVAAAAGSAASAVASASASASGFTGGSVLGEGAPGLSRRRGGSAGFDTGSVEGLRSAIAQTEAAGRASVGGLFSSQARRSLAITRQTLEEKLRQALSTELAAFTSDLVSELNRQGILDPTQRAQIIQQRTDEARRLGILSAPSTGITRATIGGTF